MLCVKRFSPVLTNSGWLPSSLGNNLNAWLDADDASSITLNGSSVSQWNDKSGNGNNAAQTANVNGQPTYSTGALNGKSVIAFDGTNDVLISSTGNFQSPISIFIVASNTSPNNNIQYRRLLNISASVDNRGFVGTNNSNFATFFGSGNLWNDLNANSPAALINSNARILGVVNSANVAIPYVDGIAQDSKNGAMTSATGYRIGSSPGNIQYWHGWVAELIITNNAVDATTREKIEGYLAWKWGLTSTLSNQHPYKTSAPT